MISAPFQLISSRDNAFLKDLRRLSQDSTAYRKQGRFWVEGEHLCGAALARGVKPVIAIFSESFWAAASSAWTQAAGKNIVIADTLFADIGVLESPASIGFVFEMPTLRLMQPNVSSVILDRVQDAGNVGSILRSASAFGFTQIIALKGTAALWSPKVLRAGMGAHWGLHLIEAVEHAQVSSLTVPIIVTSSHRGEDLHQAQHGKSLPMPCAWVLGHEGQGVGAELEAMASLHVRIAQPGGEESLNVAAAAAICLHACATGHLSTQRPQL
ncbi:MAG: RNA methyltransferase [Comamonadaceae bacterium]